MRRAVAGIWWSPTAEGTSALVVATIFFMLGGLIGCLVAFQAAGGGTEAMAAYLDRFLRAAEAGGLETPALPELLWRSVRWPLAAFLFGFSILGLLVIPALASLRGFFLAFSIASFACAYGRSGLAAAFLLLGIPALVSIPAFLLLATQSFFAAWTLATGGSSAGRRGASFSREYLFRCGACAAAVCISLLLERYLVPVLVSGAAGSLLH